MRLMGQDRCCFHFSRPDMSAEICLSGMQTSTTFHLKARRTETLGTDRTIGRPLRSSIRLEAALLLSTPFCPLPAIRTVSIVDGPSHKAALAGGIHLSVLRTGRSAQKRLRQHALAGEAVETRQTRRQAIGGCRR